MPLVRCVVQRSALRDRLPSKCTWCLEAHPVATALAGLRATCALCRQALQRGSVPPYFFASIASGRSCPAGFSVATLLAQSRATCTAMCSLPQGPTRAPLAATCAISNLDVTSARQPQLRPQQDELGQCGDICVPVSSVTKGAESIGLRRRPFPNPRARVQARERVGVRLLPLPGMRCRWEVQSVGLGRLVVPGVRRGVQTRQRVALRRSRAPRVRPIRERRERILLRGGCRVGSGPLMRRGGQILQDLQPS